MALSWFHRVCLAAVTVFWLAMNYLLWQAEFFGSVVPPATVGRRLLNPEESLQHYDIYRRGDWLHHRAPLGSYTWIGQVMDDTGAPIQVENRSRVPGAYKIRIDRAPPETTGAVELPGGQQLQFDFELDFDARYDWKALSLTLSMGAPRDPGRWTLRLDSNSTGQSLAMAVRTGSGSTNSIEVPLAKLDAQSPRLELASWVVAHSLGAQNEWSKRALGTLLGPALQTPSAPPVMAGAGRTTLHWQCHYAVLPDHSPRLRVYRLSTPLLGAQELVAYISRGGELLRAEIPVAQIELLNRQFYPLPKRRE